MCRGGRKEAKSEIHYNTKDEFRLSIVLFPCFKRVRVASDGVLSDPIVENQRVEVLRQAHPIGGRPLLLLWLFVLFQGRGPNLDSLCSVKPSVLRF